MKSNFVLLREVAIEGGDVAVGNECKVYQRITGGRERGEDASDKDVFRREVDEGEERAYATRRADGDGLRTEKILEGGEIGVRAGKKELVCGDKAREQDLIAITDETRLTES